MKKLNLKTLLGITFMAFGAASCGYVEDLPSTIEKETIDPQKKLEYEAAFKNAFGDLPEMSWDLTTGLWDLRNNTRALTRAAATAYKPIESNDYYQVETGTGSTLEWMQKTLAESKDNRKLGTPFAMTVPGNAFSITPIYQGQASLTWDLHMVVGTGDDAVDTKIWSKSEGIQTSNNGNSWSNLATSGNTLSSKNVRAKTYTFYTTGDEYNKNLPAGYDKATNPLLPTGETIYFYLEVTNSASGYANKGTKQSSLNGMMLALNCPKPTNIDQRNEVLIIGCEDADLKNSDHDLNDVVFLMQGYPYVPEPVEVDGNIIETLDVSKRYMMEDLGNCDFDFNDVVIDLAQYKRVKVEIINGIPSGNQELVGYSQKATIKHLGGTLPWNAFLVNLDENGKPIKNTDAEGNISFNIRKDITGYRYGVMDYDPNETIVLASFGEKDSTFTPEEIERQKSNLPWIPDSNNIMLKVQNDNKQSSEAVIFNQTTFEDPCKYPQIIATDPSYAWMTPEKTRFVFPNKN